jgi:hypothetical protein
MMCSISSKLDFLWRFDSSCPWHPPKIILGTSLHAQVSPYRFYVRISHQTGHLAWTV